LGAFRAASHASLPTDLSCLINRCSTLVWGLVDRDPNCVPRAMHHFKLVELDRQTSGASGWRAQCTVGVHGSWSSMSRSGLLDRPLEFPRYALSSQRWSARKACGFPDAYCERWSPPIGAYAVWLPKCGIKPPGRHLECRATVKKSPGHSEVRTEPHATGSYKSGYTGNTPSGCRSNTRTALEVAARMAPTERPAPGRLSSSRPSRMANAREVQAAAEADTVTWHAA